MNPNSNPYEPFGRSSSFLDTDTPTDDLTPSGSVYPSTAQLVPPQPSPCPITSGSAPGLELVAGAARNRDSVMRSRAAKGEPPSLSRRDGVTSIDGPEARISMDITPASPTSPKPSSSLRLDDKQHPSPLSPSTQHPVVPTVEALKANPKLSKSKPRYFAGRSPSPIPDFIDTGVKGTPSHSHPSSPRASVSHLQHHLEGQQQPPHSTGSALALRSDIPQPGGAEEGIVDSGDNNSNEKNGANGARSSSSTDGSKGIRESSWPPWKRSDGWTGWSRESIVTANLVPSLVLQAFSTGILDATTYADFKTFASNQTGNTILLTVSVIGDIHVLLLLTGISLAAFLGGAFVFGHIGHWMGVRRRIWILTSTTYQILALILAAVLVSPTGPKATHVGGKHEWVVLFLFANMSGAQVAMARQSGSQELPTAPMTSSYVDLMADKYLFVGFRHPKAGPRNRRLSYILAMIIGGLLGAAIHKYAESWPVVVVTIGLKVIVLGMMAMVQAEAPPRKSGANKV